MNQRATANKLHQEKHNDTKQVVSWKWQVVRSEM